jgi:hypothetical protein
MGMRMRHNITLYVMDYLHVFLAGLKPAVLYWSSVNLNMSRTNFTRWFKYDRDKLWLVYTQIVPVIFESPCIYCIFFSISDVIVLPLWPGFEPRLQSVGYTLWGQDVVRIPLLHLRMSGFEIISSSWLKMQLVWREMSGSVTNDFHLLWNIFEGMFRHPGSTCPNKKTVMLNL